jgi:hypothetical protein
VAGDPEKETAERAHVVLIDATGLFLNPLVRRTWAAKGRTPVFDGWGAAPGQGECDRGGDGVAGG